MRVAVAGAGAFGLKHLDALQLIDDVEIAAVVSRRPEQAREIADRYGAALATDDLNDVLDDASIDAVILCTPTQLHAEQAVAAMRAGKHVQVEIPLADSWRTRSRSTRRDRDRARLHGRPHATIQPVAPVDPSASAARRTHVQQMDVQTYFFRRTNTNALGQPRSWTDNLLWHHAAHTVDFFAYQTGAPMVVAHGLAGPPTLSSASLSTCRSSSRPRPAPLHPVTELQQRRTTRNLLPLHLRQRDLHRPLRRPRYRSRRGRRPLGRRGLEQRYRAPGSRVRGRDHRGSRAQLLGHQVLSCYETLDRLQTQLDRAPD